MVVWQAALRPRQPRQDTRVCKSHELLGNWPIDSTNILANCSDSGALAKDIYSRICEAYRITRFHVPCSWPL